MVGSFTDPSCHCSGGCPDLVARLWSPPTRTRRLRDLVPELLVSAFREAARASTIVFLVGEPKHAAELSRQVWRTTGRATRSESAGPNSHSQATVLDRKPEGDQNYSSSSGEDP